MDKLKVSVVGGSGYIGGEALRLLFFHPNVEICQVTSESFKGKFLHMVHPNLRHVTKMKFVSIEQLESCDVMFLALPHGMAQGKIDHFKSKAGKIIDLSADFRLNDAELYKKWYGSEHKNPAGLAEFVYGICEVNREKIKSANYVTGAGCLATSSILALLPLKKAGLLKSNTSVFIEAKVGSSASGNKPSLASHHPERSGAVRSFEPTGHRHTAELIQEIGGEGCDIHFSATSIEMVRGILATCHVMLEDKMSDMDLWNVYREYYGQEPFIRLVKERRGVYRYPEPKLLAGTNFCDVGFESDPNSNRVVIMSSLDNLVKGGSGNGIQAMNIMHGFDESLGLEFPGLHPV